MRCRTRTAVVYCERCLQGYVTLGLERDGQVRTSWGRNNDDLCGKCRSFDYLKVNPPKRQQIDEKILDYRRIRDRFLAEARKG